MTRRSLLRRLDHTRLEAAIAAAEARTTGEIRISVAGLFWGSAEALVSRAFVRLGMHATGDRNGVLLLVLPWRRQLIIRADVGIDAKVTPAFWQETVAVATALFKQQQFTEGLLGAVATIGSALAQHFPAPPAGSNPDELPNQIDRG
jgi:putative membrane protein